MTADTSVIGRTTARCRVVVERGPVANFATAVTDSNPVYRDAEVAAAAGLDGLPVPPTFTFAVRTWGEQPELQQDLEPVAGNAMAEAIGSLMDAGGLILHGEQSFDYHRPVVVGDVLRGEATIVDLYEKESKGRTMTFLVVETRWTDDRSGDPVVTERFNLIHRA
ncbi:MAG: FAS1-like dehydratase domain-containing protein [Acidimicrobiales bacterium]